jgi:2-polyprenyl-3-methyl-5-hydroxy-6-metoxy-1,4-benzoquinol methylase
MTGYPIPNGRLMSEALSHEVSFSQHEGCVACGSKDSIHVGMAPIINPNLDEKYEIKSCGNCSHWMTFPNPSRELLGQLYSQASLSVLGDGWAHNYATGDQTSSIASDENWVVKRLSSHRAGNYLEIGPGDGSLIRKFREMGWSAYGVDPGQYLSDHKIVASSNLLPPEIKFDVIVLQDILEHTSNPWQELQLYQEILAPGARIFMTFPWSESDEAIKIGSAWAMVRPIGHLHYFSKTSASMLMNSIGAEPLSIDVINLMPSKKLRIKNLIWLLATFPLQFMRRKVRKNPYRQRLSLLYQSWVSLWSEGDQLYVEGILRISK